MEIRNINGVFVAFNAAGKEVARSKNKYYLKQKIEGYEEAPQAENKAIDREFNCFVLSLRSFLKLRTKQLNSRSISVSNSLSRSYL